VLEMEGKAIAKWAMALAIGFAIIAVGFRWAGWLLSIFFVLNCLVLVIVVLLQSGKAADLAGAFGGAGSQTAFGPRGAANALSKATTWCAVMFMVCAMAMVLRTDKSVEQGGSVLQNTAKPAPAQPKPAAPAPLAPAPSNTAPAIPPQQPAQTPQSNPPASNKPPAQQQKPQPKP
jgi:preprotein translocase subunit SecG